MNKELYVNELVVMLKFSVSCQILIIGSKSLHTFVVIDKDINAILYVPVGLLKEKTVQLELLETHLVKCIKCFDLIVLLTVVHVIHLGVVNLFCILLFDRDLGHIIGDYDFFG